MTEWNISGCFKKGFTVTDNEFIETQIDSEKVFSGRLLHVYRDTIALPNGKISAREYIKHPGAAVIIPYLGDRKVLLIRQFRYPVGRVMTELPAGKMDGGENAEETIRRELAEETGYRSDHFVEIGTIHTCVGYSDELLHLFWADRLVPGETRPDPDEKIELLTMTIDAAMAEIYSGNITDAKTLIGLFWAEKIINDKAFAKKLIG